MEVHTASIKARILENERKTSAPLQTAMSLVLSPVQCARAASAYRVRPCASMAPVLREPSADLNRLVPGSLARPAPHVQGRRVCSEGCVLPDMATVNPAVRADPPVPAAAHLQTRVLFHRFIPSASASRSPFAAPNADVPIPVPTFAPEGELTADKVDEHIAGAFEIAEFLRRNVVQGVKNDEGNFCEHSLVRFCLVVSRADWIEPVSILPPAAVSPRFSPLSHRPCPFPLACPKFPPALRIHDETERGDNESIRKARADIPPEIKNVNLRRRRRRKDANGAASPEANAGGCGGGDGAAKP